MKTTKPRIAFITPFPPGTPTTGSELRSMGVLQALAQIGDVDVIVLNESSRDDKPAVHIQGVTIKCRSTVELLPERSLLSSIKWTLNPQYGYPNGCRVNDAAVPRILQLTRDADMTWFFKLRLADAIGPSIWSRSVLDIDDVPSTYEDRAIDVARGLPDKLSALRRHWVWKRREAKLPGRFSVLGVCSEEDKKHLTSLGIACPIYVIPNGFEKPLHEPEPRPVTPPRVGFVGLFDYVPNQDGISWFVDCCWPQIKSALPNSRLRLVGKGSDGGVAPIGPDIDRVGWVEDLSQEVSTWSVMIIPLRIGAGTRVKVAHGLSQKCPIVSTSFGVHGYDVQNGRDLYIADGAAPFAQACIRAISIPDEAARLAKNGWCRFVDKWTWDAISPIVRAAAEHCLNNAR